VDLGGTDAYLSSGDLVKKPALLSIPLATAAQTVVYNLPGVSAADHVRLDAAVLAGIYEGGITAWDDPRIAAINPGASLPADKIVPVYRADMSGDTFLFTSYLSTGSQSAPGTQWNREVGYGTTVAWPRVPAALSETGSLNVLHACASTPGCVAYNGISYLSQARLVIASLLLVISAVWLTASFLAARSDLDDGIAHGSGPAQNLALASIGVQRIRGDAVLNVISRSGSASFQDDFAATSKQVGPGDGSLLGAAAAAQQAGGHGAALVATAQQDAATWYTANNQVYQLGSAANYAAEQNLVVGTTTGSTATAYNALETDLAAAITADQAVFDSAATQGANALGPLAAIVIAASLLMAAGCGWAVSRRLAEYR
jgi:hypothetical protein